MNLACVRSLATAAAVPCIAMALQSAHAAPAPRYTLSVLETPSADWQSRVAAINNQQQIVGGVSSDALRIGNRAALWDAGGMRRLGSLHGGPSSYASGINDSGVIAGSGQGRGGPRAFVLHPGALELTDLGTLGGWGSGASAINSHGHVVGASTVSLGGATHAFVHDGQTMRSLGTLGGDMSFATDINDNGVVIGNSQTSTGGTTHRGFMYSAGSMVDLGALGGSWSEAASINDVGDIVGVAGLAPDAAGNETRRAFIYSGGAMRDLGTLGGGYSAATSINDLGDIVGMSELEDGSEAAFFYWGDEMIDLSARVDDPLWQLSQLVDINDNGYIIGQAIHAVTGAQASVLLSPVPEPQTLTLLALGLAAIGLRARRQRDGHARQRPGAGPSRRAGLR